MALKFDATGKAVATEDTAPVADPGISKLNPDVSGLKSASLFPQDAAIKPPSPSGLGAGVKLDATGSAIPADQSLSIAPVAGPVAPAMPDLLKTPPPPVKPFQPVVPQVQSTKTIAESFSGSSKLSSPLIDQMRKADELAAAGDVAGANAARSAALAASETGAGAGAGAGAGTGAGAGKTEPPAPTEKPPGTLTPEQLKSLFPDQPNLADTYKSLRDSSGLSKAEDDLVQANKDLANITAVINNTRADVEAELGGNADKSFTEAVIADRVRKLKPEWDRLSGLVTALQGAVDSKTKSVLAQVGFTQNDIENARNTQNDVRNGVLKIIDTYGSNAFKGMDPNIVSELERRGGFLPGQLSGPGAAQTLQERQIANQETQNKQNNFQSVTVNNKLYTFDKSKGTYVDSGITVPEDMKDRFAQYVEIAKNFQDPKAALDFIRTMSDGQVDTSAAIPADKTIGSLTDPELTTVIKAMAQREGFGAADPNNRPNRNNNPLNIKLGGATQHWVNDGLAAIDPVPAKDGGMFLRFKDVATGLQAAVELLKSPVYAGLGLDAALKKWSGGGYGSDVLPKGPTIDAATALKKKIDASPLKLSADQKTALAGMNGTIRTVQAIEKYVKENGLNVGPIVGTAKKIAGQTGIGEDPKYETLRAMTETLRAEVQRAISGAQMNEAEAERFKQWIPLVTDSEARFFANAQNMVKNMTQKRKELLSDPVTGQVAEGFNAISPSDFGTYSSLFEPTQQEAPFTATVDGVGTYSFPSQEMADKWKAAVEADMNK